MHELKIKQLQYESDACKRLLAFITDENIRLKIRLSEILNENFNGDLLDEIENFQNRFIKEDELIGLLRNSVAEFDKLLLKDVFEGGRTEKEINSRLNELRSNISNAEKNFNNLKSSFHSYMSENLEKSEEV